MGLNLCERCAADCRHERNPNEVVQCGALKPPMTNGDRIRTMSDNELAEILFSQRSCPPGKSRLACEASGTCLECWTEWLAKPAAEDGST